MYQGERTFGLAGLAKAISLVAIIIANTMTCNAIAAQPTASDKAQVRALMTAVAQEWLEEQGVKSPTAAPPVQQTDDSVDYLSASAGAIHHHLIALARAVPALPHEFERAIH